MSNGIVIREATSEADLNAIRALFREYQRWLGVDLCFQGFAEELRTLPGKYARPAGCFLLAEAEDRAVAGGVGLWPLGEGICEMKRLYVRPPWRGRRLGRTLAEAVIVEARKVGYATMRLDSLKCLAEALCLYRSLGFVEIPAYYRNPLDDAVFLELALGSRVPALKPDPGEIPACGPDSRE